MIIWGCEGSGFLIFCTSILISIPFPFHLEKLVSGDYSVAYDPVKTRLSESEAEAEKPTNSKIRNRTLSLVYSSASACDSDNAVFT